MGMIQHNAVIATTWRKESADAVWEWIQNLPGDEKTFFVRHGPVMNDYQTIMLAPDGSKEGWGHSDEGDARRAKFIARLEQDKYEDASSPWAYLEIGYGEFGPQIVSTNTKDCYA